MRSIIALFILGLVAGTSCSEEQYLTGVEAEAAYVDLAYCLAHSDTVDSRSAAARLRRKVDALRTLVPRPLRESELDERLYHLDRAGCAFQDALVSVDIGALDLAEIQLDRAVFELQAADAAVFGELYVGSIYDFAASWLALAATVRDAAAEEYVDPDCLNYPLAEWKRVAHLRPDPLLYPQLVGDPGTFLAAHDDLQRELRALTDKHAGGRRVTAGEVAAANEAFWQLLSLFGTGALRLPSGSATLPTPPNHSAASGPTR